MQHTDCALVAEEDLVHSAVCLVPLSYIEQDEINLAHCSIAVSVIVKF